MKILVATKKVRYCGTAGVYKGKKNIATPNITIL
jgi:hypothetical protein